MTTIIRTVIDFIKTHKYVWLTLYFIIFVIAFFLLESVTPEEGYWVTDLPIDDRIPFLPGFTWAYILWYPLFVAVGIPTIIWDGDAFKRWMYYLMITLTVTLIFDYLVPNGQNLRVESMEVNSVASWILAGLWRTDTCTNVFPSMHVVGCIGDIVAVFDSKIFGKTWRWVIVVLCLLCSASTVFVKQHAFLDMLGAVALSVPVLLIIYSKRFFGRKKESLSH